METINLNIDIQITDEDIDDIMSYALDGGITYWCGRVEVVGTCLGDYASDQISRGGTLRLYDIEDEDEVYELTKEKFLQGVRLFLVTPTFNFWRTVKLEGDDKFYINCCGVMDAEDADAIIQYALFGEIIYG